MGRAKIVSLLIACLLAASCDRSPRIVVGAKNFTEQFVLGEILAQQIENRLGVRVERKLHLGGALLAQNALTSGEIDLYPEYTGTALTAILDLPPEPDADAVWARVNQEYQRRFQVEWLPPFGFNNTFVMVIRGSDARAGNIETLSEAAARSGGWALGGGYEFEGRPDGLPALERVYGIQWSAPPRSMELGLLYQALEQGQVTMVAANGTDGLLTELDVKVLEDDRHAFPPYFPAVAVRQETLARFAGLREALLELSGAIDENAMRAMNHEVDVDHRPVAEVARAFLDRQTQ